MPGNLIRIVLLAAAALASVATSKLPSPPEPDSCDSPSQGSAASLALGYGLTDPFASFMDGDSILVTEGAQGGYMIPIKLRVEGEGSFACVVQRTEIRQAGTMIGYIDVPLHFYEVDGAWETHTNWVILSDVPAPGTTVTVSAALGDLSVSHDLTIAAGGSLVSLSPASSTAQPGQTVTFTVAMDPSGYLPTDTIVNLSSSDLAVARPLSSTASILTGSTTGVFQVAAEGAGTATIAAELSGSRVEATLTVQASALEIVPGSLTIQAGGSAIVEIHASEAVLAAGRTFDLAAGAGMAAPAALTMPDGESSATVRVYAFTGTSGFVSALDVSQPGGALAHADVIIVGEGGVASPTDLAISEVAFDVEADANCDGAAGNAGDQLVELVNTRSFPLRLDGLQVGTATVPASTLGPGEALVVAGAPIGSASARAWCIGLAENHIGDAAALSGGSLGLVGDTDLTIRAGGIVIASTHLPASAGVSLERDATGALVPHTFVAGAAADRPVTPGTRPDGSPFADQ